jgi:amidase
MLRSAKALTVHSYVSPLSIPAAAAAALFSVAAGCGPLGVPELPFRPEEARLTDVRTFVKSGVVSCRQLINRYQLLHDVADNSLRTMITWNDRVLSDADRLDQVPSAQRGSFHCVPIVVKDNINVSGLPTTGGVKGLLGTKTGSNAEVVQRFLTAGAIVLGKTNMPDFAINGINTLSSAGGQTGNPYSPSLTVYGSSGGSAAAVSASLGVIGLGTDTFGSLVQPASATGLVAIRPTQGLVSGSGILPLMSLQDMPGPMTRTVEDAAAALELMVDSKFAPQGSQSYTTMLRSDGLTGVKIGYDLSVLQALPAPMLTPSKEVQDLFSQALGNLSKGGAVTKQVPVLTTLFPALQAATDASFQCMPVDFKQSFNAYLAATRADLSVKSLAEVIAGGQFLDSVKAFITDAQAKTDTIATSTACQQYLTARTAASAAITALMDKEGVDLLVYPAANQPAFAAGAAPPAGWYGFQVMSSPTGLPSLTMPMGIAATSGAPVGMIFLARGYQEGKLVQAGYSYQKQFKPRSAPPAVVP